jgi:hypothetical protein
MSNVTSEAVEVQAGPPSELRALTQWVAFKLEPRPGQPKPAKVPYKSPDQRAKTTDPADWLTHELAVVLASEPGFAGVGFVFSDKDGYAGIDLDGVRDKDTGVITDEAWQIVRQFASYTELSPSGTGLHIIVRGSITAAAKRNGVEVYDRSRYFTVTGLVLDGHSAIADAPDLEAFAAQYRSPALVVATATTDLPPVKNTHLPDDDLLALIKRKKTRNETRLRGYFRPDGDRDHDRSKDDYQLALGLAKYVGGDVDRIEQLMRRSELVREKWNRRGDDYLQRTILRAVQAAAIAMKPVTQLPTFTDITILLTEPRQYEVTVDGTMVRVDSRTLLSPLLFERALLEATNRIMPTVKRDEWRDLIQPLLDKATQVEAPEDATTLGRLKTYVVAFLGTRHKSDNLSDILLGKAAVDPDTGNICFLAESLFSWLDKSGWKVTKSDHATIYASLRQLGAKYDQQQRSVKGKKRRLWWFPASFVDGEEQTESFTHPTTKRPY